MDEWGEDGRMKDRENMDGRIKDGCLTDGRKRDGWWCDEWIDGWSAGCLDRRWRSLAS